MFRAVLAQLAGSSTQALSSEEQSALMKHIRQRGEKRVNPEDQRHFALNSALLGLGSHKTAFVCLGRARPWAPARARYTIFVPIGCLCETGNSARAPAQVFQWGTVYSSSPGAGFPNGPREVAPRFLKRSPTFRTRRFVLTGSKINFEHRSFVPQFSGGTGFRAK